MRRYSICRQASRPGLGWLAALVVVASAGSGAGADPASSAAPTPVPRVEVEAEEIDLGEVARGDTVEARFLLRNTGERELRILEVKPG